MLTVNRSQVQSIKLSKDFLAEDGTVRLPKDSSLTDLIDIGVMDASAAPAVLSAVFAELARQTQ